MTKHAFQTNRHDARRRREVQTLHTFKGRVRSTALMPDGRASCVLDTDAGRLRAVSDAVTVHLPELRIGRPVQVVLLRLRRETFYGTWDWQLLACQGADEADLVESAINFEGSHA